MNISIILAQCFQLLIFAYGVLYLCRPGPPSAAPRKKKFIKLLAVSFLGIACGLLQSFQAPPPYFRADLLTLLTLAMAPATAMGIAQSRTRPAYRLVIINVLTAASIFVLITNVFSLQHSLLGSFLRADSTPVTYSVIYLGFFGITRILDGKHRTQGIVLATCGILVSVLALAKWSLPATVILSALLLTSTYSRMGKASRSQHKKLMLSVGGIVVLLFLSLTLGGDRLAQRHGFDDFDAFLYNRVLLKDSTVEVGTTGIFINVRDSGRFEMWQDSIERTLDSPWLGIGIGSRPLDVIGANTHNVAIFMLGSMGIPLFTLYCIQLVRLFRLVLLRLPNDRRYHFAFWGWLGYVVLGFSVGASFDQAFNVLFASLPFGFFATATDSVYLKAPVGPRRIRGRTRSRNVPPAGRHNYRPQGRARVS